MKIKCLNIKPEEIDYGSEVYHGQASISSLLLKNTKPVAPSFFAGISKNPWTLIEDWELNKHIRSFIKENPRYRYRTVVDVLFSVSKEQLANYPEVDKIRDELMTIAHAMTNNFTAHVQNYLGQDLNLSESQVASLKDFINLKTYKKLRIKEVKIMGEVTEEQAMRCLKSFETISTLIPDKYKKNIPPIELVICEENDNKPAFVVEKETPTVVVYKRESVPLFMSEILHEYGHLIENFNPQVKLLTNDFLRNRILSSQTQSIESLSVLHHKAFSSWNASEVVYPSDLIDPYMGKAYGDLMKENCSTELLSTALQMLYIDPIKLFLRDPDCFKLVSSLFHGEM